MKPIENSIKSNKGKNAFIASNSSLKEIDQARQSKGLLTSQDIKEIRVGLGLNQKEFSLLLGLGEISVARYETKLIQSHTINDLFLKAKTEPLFLYEKYLENKKNLSLNAREKIVKKIKSISSSETMIHLAKVRDYRFLMLPYLEESSLIGDASLSLNAIASLLTLGKDENGSLSKRRFAKFLFYCDFFSFAESGRGITGLAYRKAVDGVEPLFYDDILCDPLFKKTAKIVFDKNGSSFSQVRIATKEKITIDREQREIAKYVKERFRSFSEHDFSLHCLNERPLKKLKNGALIDYSLSITLSNAK